MLKERHTHECGMGRNCGRALLYDTAGSAKSHRLFNQGFQVAGLKAGCSQDWLPHQQSHKPEAANGQPAHQHRCGGQSGHVRDHTRGSVAVADQLVQAVHDPACREQ